MKLITVKPSLQQFRYLIELKQKVYLATDVSELTAYAIISDYRHLNLRKFFNSIVLPLMILRHIK